MHVLVHNKSAPAYDGARFDVDGFCVVHSDIRLCRLIDGKYKTVRKICFKCGAIASRNQKTKLNGRRKNSTHRRDVPTSIGVSTGFDGCQAVGERHGKKPERPNSQNPPCRSARRLSKDLTTDAKHPSYHAPKEGDILRRRGRTLSPLRKSIPNSQKKPSSTSGVTKKKVTDEKIKELIMLMPPLYTKNTNAGCSGTHNAQSRKKGTQTRTPRRQEIPFDEEGFCRAHPEVRLAKKNPEGGEWEVVSGLCPQCCVSAALACKQNRSKKNSTDVSDDMIGKVFATKCDDSHQTLGTEPSSSDPSSPESISKPAFSTEYFTHANRNLLGLALDITKGEQLVADLNESYVSETTAKHRNFASRRTKKKAVNPSSSKEPPGRRL
mmetsp:Transcript_41391/g.86882  ORF Transcript_41391/g.86882 Transcript_41391/m.86882 type:complete len:380 (-) Transcript_41391:111-1250(-)